MNCLYGVTQSAKHFSKPKFILRSIHCRSSSNNKFFGRRNFCMVNMMEVPQANRCPENSPIMALEVLEAWEGINDKSWPIIARQTSPESEELLELIFELFKITTVKVDAEKPFDESFTRQEWNAVLDYVVFCIGNLGNYKCVGDAKVFPNIPKSTFDKVVLASKSEKAATLWKRIGKQVYDTSPHLLELGFPPSQSSQYCRGGVTKEDADIANRYLTHKGLSDSAWNTRLERRDDLLIIWRASVVQDVTDIEEFEGQKIQIHHGDYTNQLSAVWAHLKHAGEHATEHQATMLEMLRAHFHTGDMQQHKLASEVWVKDKAPAIETTIGFIETLRDPAGVRAEFEGFVAMTNEQVSKKFGQLVDRAEQLLGRLPWSKEFENDVFVKPEFTSLDVLSFCSGSLPLGICLPNYDEVRKNGFKNVDLGNVCSARSPDMYSVHLSFSDKNLFAETYSKADQVLTGLHELIGHGSGKLFKEDAEGNKNFGKVMNPVTKKEVTSCYKPGDTYGTVFGGIASSMEECRAECVSLFLGIEHDIQEIFGFRGKKADDSVYAGWLGMCWLGLKALEHYSPEKGSWGAVHGCARYAILRHLLNAEDDDGEKLLEIVEKLNVVDGDKDVTLRMDRDLIETVGKEAIGKLLKEIHIARCTADLSLAENYKKLIEVPDKFLEYREIVMARRMPRGIFVQPTTHEDRNGVIVLRTYPATRHGLIESFCNRTVQCRMTVGYKPRTKQEEKEFQRQQAEVSKAFNELQFSAPGSPSEAEKLEKSGYARV